MLITSGLVVQNRASFRGFPSNRSRVTTVERPGYNDGFNPGNSNTSKKYPDEIIKPGVVFPSQVAYRNIFGKGTTADERLYFMQHGVMQNALSQRGKGSKLRRQPYKNRFTQNVLMDYMESVALDNYNVIDRSLPIEDVVGINAAGYRNPRVEPSEGTIGPVVQDRSEAGSHHTLDMHARTPDETMLSPLSAASAGSLLGLGNVDLGLELMNAVEAAANPVVPVAAPFEGPVAAPVEGMGSPVDNFPAMRRRYRALGMIDEPVTPGNTLPAYSPRSSITSAPSYSSMNSAPPYSPAAGMSPLTRNFQNLRIDTRREAERTNARPIQRDL